MVTGVKLIAGAFAFATFTGSATYMGADYIKKNDGCVLTDVNAELGNIIYKNGCDVTVNAMICEDRNSTRDIFGIMTSGSRMCFTRQIEAHGEFGKAALQNMDTSLPDSLFITACAAPQTPVISFGSRKLCRDSF